MTAVPDSIFWRIEVEVVGLEPTVGMAFPERPAGKSATPKFCGEGSGRWSEPFSVGGTGEAPFHTVP